MKKKISIIGRYAAFVLVTCILIFSAGSIFPRMGAFASDQGTMVTDDSIKDTPDTGVLYRVMGIVLAGWIGIFVFMLFLERRIRRIEKEMESENESR